MESQAKILICELHCRFYKKEKKEEYACKGFEILERFINKNRIDEKLKGLKIKPEEITFGDDATLKEIVCRKCDFFIDGCDFRDQNCSYNAPPCGGFVLLSYLFEKQDISREDIENI